MGWLQLQDINTVIIRTLTGKLGQRDVSSCDVCKQLPLQDFVYRIVVDVRLALFKNTNKFNMIK